MARLYSVEVMLDDESTTPTRPDSVVVAGALLPAIVVVGSTEVPALATVVVLATGLPRPCHVPAKKTSPLTNCPPLARRKGLEARAGGMSNRMTTDPSPSATRNEPRALDRRPRTISPLAALTTRTLPSTSVWPDSLALAPRTCTGGDCSVV